MCTFAPDEHVIVTGLGCVIDMVSLLDSFFQSISVPNSSWTSTQMFALAVIVYLGSNVGKEFFCGGGA